MSYFRLVLVGVCCCIVSGWFGSTIRRGAAQQPQSARTWSDDTGQFKIEATYQGKDGSNVTLKKPDGTLIRVPLARLSSEDRKHIESLTASNPFVPVSNLPAGINEALVRVQLRMADGTEATAAGLVFHWDDKRAYVLTDFLRPLDRQVKSQPASVAILRDASGEPRRVAAEFIANPEQFGRCIVGAPRADLPGPLQWAQTSDVREGAHVAISGYEFDMQMQPPSYARVQAVASINKVFLGPTNEIIKWGIDSPDLSKVQYGIASLPDGKVIGLLQVESTGAGRTVTILTTTGLQFMKEPRLEKIDFEPVSGDAQTVRYGFLVSVVDPFNRLKSPKLNITPNHFPGSGGIGGGLGRNPPRTPTASPAPVERDLVAGTEKDELVAKFGTERRGAPSVKLLVAYLEEPNPGPGVSPRFNLTVTGKSPEGKPLNLTQSSTHVSFFVQPRGMGPPMRVPGAFNPPGAPASNRPNIPGLDGLPLELPRPTKHPSGGWLITSDMTRVKEQPQPSGQDFPQPARSKPAESERSESENGPLKWMLLPYPTSANTRTRVSSGMFGGPGFTGGFGGSTVTPMAYSGNGKWLYLVDGEQVLHKLDALTLAEAASLTLQQKCNEMAISKAGLVLSLPDARVLWVLDPETLVVRRAISLSDVLLLSGSPGTDIGFAVTWPGDQVTADPAQLVMLDLAQGKQVHVIKSFYGSTSPASIQIDDMPIFPRFPKPTDLAQTADGKSLLLGTSRVVKFRLAGDDLVFEQATSEQRLAPAGHFVLRADGQRLVTRADTGNISQVVAGLFDLADLSKPLTTFGADINLQSLALDPKTGNIYTAEMDFTSQGSLRTAIHVFGPNGAKLATGNIPGQAPWKIYVHPAGERFIVRSESQIVAIALGSVSRAGSPK